MGYCRYKFVHSPIPRGGIMTRYIIRRLCDDGFELKTIAAFSLIDGEVQFDMARCDIEFLHRLLKGIPLQEPDGKFKLVKPNDGDQFAQACLEHYSSEPIICNDEDDLEMAERIYAFDDAHLGSIPPAMSL